MPDSKIFSAVESAQREFKQAQRTFSQKGDDLTRRANSTSIHISSAGAYEADKLRSLVKEGVQLSKDYFVKCETLVGMLDEICRPLLAQKPSAQAVGAVASLISEIVKDLDETRVSYNVNLNGSHLGSTETDAFKPSIVSRVIAEFWNHEYRTMPGYFEEEQRRKDEAKKEKQREQNSKLASAQTEKELQNKVNAALAAQKSDPKHRKALKEKCENEAKAYKESAERALESLIAELPSHREKERKALEKRAETLRAEMKGKDRKTKAEYEKKLRAVEDEMTVIGTEQYIEKQKAFCRKKTEEDISAYKEELDRFYERSFAQKTVTHTLAVPKNNNAFTSKMSDEENVVWGYFVGTECAKSSEIFEYHDFYPRATVGRALRKLRQYGLIYMIEFGDTVYYVTPGATAHLEASVYAQTEASKKFPLPPALCNQPDGARIHEYKDAEIEALKQKRQRKKEIGKKASVAAAILALLLAVALITPAVISSVRMSEADGLFTAKDYEAALEIYESLDGFGESEKRIATLKAIDDIEKGKLKGAVASLLEAGVPVELTYDPAGGNLSARASVSEDGKTVVNLSYASDFSDLATPTKNGYDFRGWAFESYSYTLDDVFKLSVTAGWRANSYTVTFEDVTQSYAAVTLDGNYEGADPERVILYDGDRLTYPEEPERSGYVFTGWYTDSACTNRYDFTGTLTEDLTLYAGWLAQKTQSVLSNTVIRPEEHDASYKAYKISTDKTSENAKIYLYLVAKEAGEHTVFYANSTSYENSYHLSAYNLTTGETLLDDEGVTTTTRYNFSFTCNAGDVIALELYRYSASGDSFASFYFVDFEAIESKTVAKIPDDGKKYNGGQSCTEIYTFDSAYQLPVPTRPGHTFLGWYHGETKMENGTWSIASDVTLTPKWEAGSNTVTLDPNGGTVSENNITVTYGQEFTLPTPAAREHYTFLGWYSGETKFESGVWNRTQSMTLTAKWEPVSYTVTYHLSDGTNSPMNPEAFTVESERISLEDPARPGHKFLGWYTDSAYTNPITEIAAGSHGSLALYAKWETVTYTVTYELGGGTVSQSLTQSFTVNDLPLALPTPTKEGLAFVNWSKNTVDGEMIESITEIGDITVIACYIDPNLKMTLSVNKTYYTVTEYMGSASHVEIPPYYMGLPVEVIGNGAFTSMYGGTDKLLSVTLPDTLKKIGDEAFKYQSMLESIVIPDSVTQIGEWAFYHCSALESITFSENLKEIGDVCFSGCTSLEQIVLPDSLTSLGGQSFKECTSLKTVTLSKGLKEIEYMTFQSCSSLISIALHEGIETIGNNAFTGCIRLETIVIPKSVTKMAVAFSGCSALDIYCRASTVPSGWTSGWNGDRPVTWGY